MALDLVSRRLQHHVSHHSNIKREVVMDFDGGMNVQHSTSKMTNFSIAEILKPNFGVNPLKRERHDMNISLIPTTPAKQKCDSSRQVTSPASSYGSLSPTGTENSEPRQVIPEENEKVWPAWVFCTRYSDRPSSGPRSRKIRKKNKSTSSSPDDKRPRTAFSNEQLDKLQIEFESNRYLTEQRRRSLSMSLDLSETQIKIWFQNKRAKLKKSNGGSHDLAQHLLAQGLYNHTTITVREEGN